MNASGDDPEKLKQELSDRRRQFERERNNLGRRVGRLNAKLVEKLGLKEKPFIFGGDMLESHFKSIRLHGGDD